MRLLPFLCLLSCSGCPAGHSEEHTPVNRPHQSATSQRTRPSRAESMVRSQIVARGVKDPRVLAAMRRVPRHRFVPAALGAHAYADRPLPIGHRQTISQPYIVAYMSEALRVQPQSRVLEIGTGSGYQAAVLAELAKEVYSIEIVAPLGIRARALLEKLGYRNIVTRIGDGYAGWPDKAPFDRIMLTAAPPQIPKPLIDQLAINGILVAPVGRSWQYLVRWTKTPEGLKKEQLLGVRFVPMTGEVQRRSGATSP